MMFVKSQKPKKILIAAGGTGGHLFPAQALADKMQENYPDAEILFAGEGLNSNKYFLKERFLFQQIASATPMRSNPLKAFGSIAKGCIQSFKLLFQFKPSIVIGFGSFHTFPLLVAATLMRIPFVLYESNCLPGRVNRLFSRFAVISTVQFSEASNALHGRVVEVTMPLWESSRQKIVSVGEARAYFGLHSEVTTILVFGGSQGSNAINAIVVEALKALAAKGKKFQVIHLAGKAEKADDIRCEYLLHGVTCCVKGFEDRMTIAWRAADLVICRAGAASLAEQIAFEVPGILVPYPYASEQHQTKNALFMQEQVQGGRCILEEHFEPVTLSFEIAKFLDAGYVNKMKENIRNFKNRQVRSDLFSVINNLLHKNLEFHLIGIGGIGMSAVARLLLSQGYRVTGSDARSSVLTDALKEEGAEIFIGQKKENIPLAARVVYSTDIKEDNPEFEGARALELPLLHRSQVLHEQMQKKRALCVSGTHGKTTTSSLLAHTLLSAGKDPSFAVGGIVQGINKNAYWGKGEDFVAEADESDGSFLVYRPFGAILTNIDNDHMNHWHSFDQLVAGFAEFACNVQSSKHLIWCSDDPVLCSLNLPGISYGFSKIAQAVLSNYRSNNWTSQFDLNWAGTTYSDITIPLIGKHNALNAAAVFIMGILLGNDEKSIRHGIETFSGVKRRSELKGEWQGISVYDDYAHHPTEVTATLNAFKNAIDHRRLIVVFQPHRFTRLSECFKDFATSFSAADEIILTDVYSAGETPIEGINAQALLEEVRHNSKKEAHFAARESLVDFLSNFTRTGDVVVTMGAGDVTKVGQELIEKWRGHGIT